MANLESRITKLERAADPADRALLVIQFDGETKKETLQHAGLSTEDTAGRAIFLIRR